MCPSCSQRLPCLSPTPVNRLIERFGRCECHRKIAVASTFIAALLAAHRRRFVLRRSRLRWDPPLAPTISCPLSARVIGHGAPIVLLHGLGASGRAALSPSPHEQLRAALTLARASPSPMSGVLCRRAARILYTRLRVTLVRWHVVQNRPSLTLTNGSRTSMTSS